MKKILLTLCLIAGVGFATQAQKFATVDMGYIMKNIPAFESANEQLNQVSKKWQAEIDVQMKEVQQLYKNLYVQPHTKQHKQNDVLYPFDLFLHI